jgi:aspartyl-tRNA(Asn)/glutamyl-tRNA(Gln) amidotransferase subunit C
MSHLTEADIRKVAKLARINLLDEEVPHFQAEISSILNWVEQLNEVNTDDVTEMASVENMALPLRDDAVTDGNMQQDVLKNAPHSEYGCFMVPKVVE